MNSAKLNVLIGNDHFEEGEEIVSTETRPHCQTHTPPTAFKQEWFVAVVDNGQSISSTIKCADVEYRGILLVRVIVLLTNIVVIHLRSQRQKCTMAKDN